MKLPKMPGPGDDEPWPDDRFDLGQCDPDLQRVGFFVGHEKELSSVHSVAATLADQKIGSALFICEAILRAPAFLRWTVLSYRYGPRAGSDRFEGHPLIRAPYSTTYRHG